MKYRVVVTAVALGFGASAARANPDPVAPTQFSSSDTLRNITVDVIAACGVGAQLEAAGGGSSLAGTRMSPLLFPPNGMQQVAPQSRFMNSTECNAVGPNQGQGIQIGLDGIAAFHDDTELSPCRVLRYAGCMPIQDLNGGIGLGVAGQVDDGTGAAGVLGASGNAAIPLVNGQYCFTHWADALRIIYTGQHQHVDNSSPAAACNPVTPTSSLSTKRCNSDVRRTLVENWANMFDTEGDDGAGGCDDLYCLRLRHAWRRDDFSGTTDVFLALIGAPGVSSSFNVRTFCNGLQSEDLDPIRRPCSINTNAANDPVTVCAPIPFANRNAPFSTADGSPTGAPGSSPVTPPPSGAVGDLGLVLAMSLPQDLSVQYDTNFCATAAFGGSFKFAPMPTVALPQGQKCPDGNSRVAGQCRFPVYSAGANIGKFNCRVRRTNRAGGAVWANYDARAYNLVPRDPTTGAIALPNSTSIGDARWGGAGHYRIHMAFPEVSQTAEVLFAEHPTCLLQDATRQIGCLVQADACSIGFAGLEGEDQDANEPDTAVIGANLPFLLRSPVDANTSELNSDDIEIDPRISTIHRLTDVTGSACAGGAGNFDIRYPLARVLWFNSSKGFGGFPVNPAFPNISNTVDSDPDISPTNPSQNGSLQPDGVPDLLTREKDVSVCFADRAIVDPILELHGFIPLPTPGSYPDSARFRQCP
jgi:hypothetical protein